ncbi:MAG: efflux RND transporter periplasmic adaptor subunit [Planctomycetota bacterium]
MMKHWVLLLAWLSVAACGKATAPSVAASRSPILVEVATAKMNDVPIIIPAIGSVLASESVLVRPQVTALIRSIQFTEGSSVTAGTPLFQLDDRPFVAALQQAEADLVRSRAAERQAAAFLERQRSQLALAEIEERRTTDLAGKSLITEQLVAQIHAALRGAHADVLAADAAVATAHAGVIAAESAVAKERLNVSWCSIVAPLSGRTGILGMTAGNLAVANQTELITIVRMQPILMDFSVPGANLAAIQAAQLQGPVVVEASLEQGGATETGTLTMIDNQINSASGSIRLRAMFTNANMRLWPGQQCRVAMHLGVELQVVTVPEKAVQAGQRGNIVWVVQADQSVAPQVVEVRRSNNGLAVIGSGVTAGMRVVIDGQFQLTQGTKVGTKADAAGKVESARR